VKSEDNEFSRSENILAGFSKAEAQYLHSFFSVTLYQKNA